MESWYDRLKGKVAIITGGGAGIGEACCTLFAAEGAQVVVAEVNDRDGQRLPTPSTATEGARISSIATSQ